MGTSKIGTLFSAFVVSPQVKIHTQNFFQSASIFHSKERTFVQNMGKIQVFVILSTSCDLVHVQSVIYLFAKQLYNALKPALNHQNMGKITKIRALYGRFPTNAQIYRRARIYTGELGTLVNKGHRLVQLFLLHSFVQNGGKKWTLNKVTQFHKQFS